MTDSINLTAFCAVKDFRGWMNTPIRFDFEHVAATDGSILVLIKAPDGGRDDPENAAKLGRHVEEAKAVLDEDGWISISEIRTIPDNDCRLCGGTGCIEKDKCVDCGGRGDFEYGHHNYVCQHCGGEGELITPATKGGRCFACTGSGQNTEAIEFPGFEVEGEGINAVYAELIRRHLPNAELLWLPDRGHIAIRFNGGFGVVMKCSRRIAQ